MVIEISIKQSIPAMIGTCCESIADTAEDMLNLLYRASETGQSTLNTNVALAYCR
jgi:hypothetical protein